MKKERTVYKIEVGGCIIMATARLTAQGVPFPFEKDSRPQHNRYSITVMTDAHRHSFNFYGSIADYEGGKVEMSADDIRQALENHVSDALSGCDTFADFCGNFCYDADSRTAERIYRACKRELGKWEAAGIGEDALRTIGDKLREEE
jgi:hypothetical protein